MKKATSIILALLIVCSMCFTSVFAATTSATLTAETSAASANAGDVITLAVNLSENSNLGTLTFRIEYDTSAFEYVEGSLTKGAIFPNEEINDKTAGSLLYTAFTGSSVTVGGAAATAQFKVLKVNSTISISVEEAYDSNDNDVTTSLAHNASGVTINCAHGTTEWETITPATHETDGEKAEVCSACGETVDTDVISAEGHSFGEWVVTTPATCTLIGVETRACSCGKEETRDIPELSHNAGEWVEIVAPTCTEKGKEEQRCTECGTLLDTYEVDENGHKAGEWKETKAPACTENGEEEQRCTECGKLLNTREIGAVGHSYGEWVVTTAPTCTEVGYETHTCHCGASETHPISAIGHSYGAWSVTVEPTCTEKGVEIRVCACGEVESREVSATGHSVSEYTIVKESTCTDNGEKKAICHCGEEFTEAIPALGHSYGEWTVIKEATVDVEGEKERVCAACGEKETAVIAKLEAEKTPENNENTGNVENPVIPNTGANMVVLSFAIFAALACIAMSILVLHRKRCK